MHFLPVAHRRRRSPAIDLTMLGPVAIIIVLFVVGFALIATEVCVPGMILGTLGFLCLAASVAVVFSHYGVATGVIAASVTAVLALGGFMLWLWIFPKTFIGRKIILSQSQPSAHAAKENHSLVGSVGIALTMLRPAGTARIGERRVDVTTAGEFVEEGVELMVIAADGLRVVVRQKDRLEAEEQSV